MSGDSERSGTFRIGGLEVRKGRLTVGLSMGGIVGAVAMYAGLHQIGWAPDQLIGWHTQLKTKVLAMEETQKRVVKIQERTEAENTERDFQTLIDQCMSDKEATKTALNECFQRARAETRRRRAAEKAAAETEDEP